MAHCLPPDEAQQHSAYAAMRAFALCFPGAHEEFPWGHCAIKVRGKMFLSMGVTEETFSFSLKLTDSNFEALLLPFTQPTRYGLGKSGWVSGSLPLETMPPMSSIRAWIEESYRAIALKSLVKQLDELGGVASFPKAPAQGQPRKQAKKRGGKKVAKKKAGSTKASTSSKKKVSSKKTTSRKKRPASKKASTARKQREPF